MSEIFNVSTNPHVRSGNTTQTIMRDVLIALTPASIFGIVNFGLDALLRIVIGIVTCVACEALYQYFMHKKVTVTDLSAAVTGLLIALNIPSKTLCFPKIASKIGISDIVFCPDDNSKWDIKPNEKAYENALLHKNIEYYRVTTIREIKEALYLAKQTNKHMFIIIGIKVYESFESDECMKTGIVPKNSGEILGGHALLVDAYDESDINFKYIEIDDVNFKINDENI